MSRPRKLTDEQIAAAAVMWLADVERKIIAKEVKCGLRTLYDNVWPSVKRAKTQSARLSDSPTAEISPLMGSTAA